MGELQRDEEQYPSEFDEVWIKENGKIVFDEGRLADIFLKVTGIRCWHGRMFNDESLIGEETLKREVARLLKEKYHWRKNIPSTATRIAETIRYFADEEEIDIDPYQIHLKNGTVDMRTGKACFTEEFRFSPYRLPVEYNPKAKDPKCFMRWVHDLLDEEDIHAFQEMLGYFLIPTTKAQKAFFLIGEGGSGKSILVDVLVAILGDAFTPIQLCKLNSDGKFDLSPLENHLVAYDDDMVASKMNDTSVFKQVVTAKAPMLFERKNVDPYKYQPYVRLVGSGNFNLGSLYDKSEGYYRRLHVFEVRAKAKNRVDDPFLGDKIRKESEGILIWALAGLERLLKNNYRFSESQKTKELLEQIRHDDDPFAEFIEDMVIFAPDARVPRPRTWEAYRRFCHENGSKIMGQQSFYSRLKVECKRRGGDLRRLDSGTWTFLGMKLREVDSGIRIKGVTR